MRTPHFTLGVLLLVCNLARADDDGYELVRSAATALKPGAKTTLSLSVVPRSGHHLLASGPVVVRLTGDGVRALRPALDREDAVDPHADVPRFELPLLAEKKGEAHVRAACTFWLCRESRCRPIETTAEWTIKIE